MNSVDILEIFNKMNYKILVLTSIYLFYKDII